MRVKCLRARSNLFGDPSLGLAFIEKNAKSVVQSHGFTELSKDRLLVLLQSSDLRIREIDLFLGVVKWCKAQIRRNGDLQFLALMRELVPFIRFPLFTVQDLSIHVNPLQILSQQEMLELYTYIACKDSKAKQLPKVSFPTEPRANTGFAFTWQRLGAAGRLDNNQLTLVSTGGSYCCALANQVIVQSSGQHYWEIRIDNIGSRTDWQIGFGVGTEALPLDQYLSHSASGWAYFNQGIRAHQSGAANDHFGQAFSTGDVIGVLFDSDKGQLFFFRNRVNLGLCFSNIFQNVYPAAHVNQNASVTIIPDAVMPS